MFKRIGGLGIAVIAALGMLAAMFFFAYLVLKGNNPSEAASEETNEQQITNEQKDDSSEDSVVVPRVEQDSIESGIDENGHAPDAWVMSMLQLYVDAYSAPVEDVDSWVDSIKDVTGEGLSASLYTTDRELTMDSHGYVEKFEMHSSGLYGRAWVKGENYDYELVFERWINDDWENPNPESIWVTGIDYPSSVKNVAKPLPSMDAFSRSQLAVEIQGTAVATIGQDGGLTDEWRDEEFRQLFPEGEKVFDIPRTAGEETAIRVSPTRFELVWFFSGNGRDQLVALVPVEYFPDGKPSEMEHTNLNVYLKRNDEGEFHVYDAEKVE